jgi:general nucleoside transport system permease protein
MTARSLRTIWPAVPIVLAVLATTLLLFAVGANPLLAFSAFFEGAFGSSDQALATLAFWVPLLLCSTGLLVTFTSGMWNIGVEGQMIMGSVGATWVALTFAVPNPGIPGWIIIPAEMAAAMLLAAVWAALNAVLKTRGGIHEIFGGVAMNNLAIIITNFLISGPWEPPRGGTFRATVPFTSNALLPLFATSRFSMLSLVVALVALLAVALVLRRTYWGLRLKALGKNLRSAFMLGISSEREAIIGMMVCGALAGLGGMVRVTSWFDSLRQSISGGIGFLAILIVLLAGTRPVWTLVIALIFSGLLNGGTIVQLRTQLHSALSGIIQGLLVLFVLLFGDFGQVFRKQETGLETEEGQP